MAKNKANASSWPLSSPSCHISSILMELPYVSQSIQASLEAIRSDRLLQGIVVRCCFRRLNFATRSHCPLLFAWHKGSVFTSERCFGKTKRTEFTNTSFTRRTPSPWRTGTTVSIDQLKEATYVLEDVPIVSVLTKSVSKISQGRDKSLRKFVRQWPCAVVE
jgi:hypothetical protein